jgi:long-chain fatty acid transport protein
MLLTLSSTPQAFGSGFALFEGSARGTALGQTLVGRADDPSTIFYNPAGITQLQGFQVMAGDTAISPSIQVNNPTATSTRENWRFPPHLYGTYQFSDRVWFGLGAFSPFGLAVEFPQTWLGRFNSFDAQVQTLTINPTVAFKLTDDLSLAIGLDAMWFDITLKQFLPLPVPTPISQRLTGDSLGFGWNAGILYRPCQWVSLGVAYRSKISQTVDGRAEFSPQLVVSPLLNLTDKGASSSISLPDELFLGLTFYPTKNLSWEIGGVWTRWGSFKELTIRYASPIIGTIDTVTAQKNWQNVWRFQTGLEYKTTPWLDLRIGYIYDTEAVNDLWADYLVPSSNRHYFSFGPGFHWQKWTLDLSYTYVMVQSHTVTNSQSTGYINPSQLEDGNVHLIGASVGYKF